MINQRNTYVTFNQSLSDYFRGFKDFKGETSRRGYWYPMLGILLLQVLVSLVISFIIFIFMGTMVFFNSDNFLLGGIVTSAGLSIIMQIIFFIIMLPDIASSVRRYRNVGLTGRAILTGVLVTIGTAILSLALPFLMVIPPLMNILAFVLLLFPQDYLVSNSKGEIGRFLFRQYDEQKNFNQEPFFNTNTGLNSKQPGQNNRPNTGYSGSFSGQPATPGSQPGHGYNEARGYATSFSNNEPNNYGQSYNAGGAAVHGGYGSSEGYSGQPTSPGAQPTVSQNSSHPHVVAPSAHGKQERLKKLQRNRR